MLKQELIITCLLAAQPNQSKEAAEAFAASVWQEHFSDVQFHLWNGQIDEASAAKLIAEAKSRKVLSRQEVADLMRHIS